MGRKQYAPKGQKYIAQGSALGRLIPNNNAPCKGALMIRAYALAGRKIVLVLLPRALPWAM